MAALRPQTRARHLQLKIQKSRQQLAEAEAALAALPPLGVEAPPPAPLIPAETFAKAFLASPTLMALSELETGRYVDVNEAFLRTLGFEREAVVGRTAQELGLFAQPEQRQAALEQLQAEGRLRNFEVAVRARSGELRTGRFAAEFVHVGERRLLLTVMEDITDQRRTEAALLASEARFRSYVEFAPHAIFVADRQGRYVDFNPAALDLLGYPPAELARLSIADVVAEVDLERGLQSFGVVMSAGRAEGEFRLRHRAGHVVWVALRAVRLNDERFIAFCQDVTAQHAAEQAAHTSEARYRTTLDAMLEGCQIIGFDWRYLYLNEAAVRQARQTGAALLGRTMPEAYPGIETTELFAVLQRCMADRQPRRIDNEFTYPDGQVGRFELSIQPVAEGLFILSQDVSARRQAEAALRRSEERFRLLAENMADVIWILDTATLHFSYVSPSVERLRGYTVAEVLAQTIDQVMTPASLAMIQAELPGRLAAFLAGDPAVVTQTHEVEQIRRDGSLVWTEVVTTLLRQPGGGVEILGVSRDISERRRAADALRESETRYRALFEGAAIGIFHSTFEGQYLDLNPALARMLGYATPAEVLADIHDVARQTYTDPARRETIIAQLLDQGGTLVVENRYHRRGGPDWDAYLHLRCVTDPAGRPLYLEGFVEDITERKRAETALRESERKLQTLIELLPIGISILNAERRVVYANPALCRILDMDREQFFQGAYRGRRYLNADRTPMPADGFASLRALREGRPVLDVETGVVTEAGREMWASVSAVPVDFADWRVVIATADITARKRAETALRESEARYRGLVDSAPDAI
ncbi:MAG: PAS domain S-box protein, partial [Anaerolineales bacterium]|nr:PAS domain S-box protein [Anaerolineales bacterium]